MWPLEALLSGANLLTLFTFAVPLPQAAGWLRHSATAAFVVVAATSAIGIASDVGPPDWERS